MAVKTVDTYQDEQKSLLLARAELFASLEPGELDFLASHSCLYDYAAGEHIYSDGFSRAELYIIESGRIGIFRGYESGRETAIARFVSGESFGELGLLSDAPKEETARTEEASRILIFPRREEHFADILSAHPALSARLLRKLMEAIASRLRQANSLIKQNSPWVRELRRQVYTDSLTGLPNRTYLEENLAGFFSPPPCALLMLKPDNFKQINDTYGHEAGDSAIQTIGRFLSGIAGTGERVARYMGNEYALICPGTDLNQALVRAREVQKGQSALKYAQNYEKNTIAVSVSVGIAVYPLHGATVEKVIELAHSLAMRGRTIGGSQILYPPEHAGEEQ